MFEMYALVVLSPCQGWTVLYALVLDYNIDANIGYSRGCTVAAVCILLFGPGQAGVFLVVGRGGRYSITQTGSQLSKSIVLTLKG